MWRPGAGTLSSIKTFEFLKEQYEDVRGNAFKVNPVKSKSHQIKLTDRDQTPTSLLPIQEWQRFVNPSSVPKIASWFNLYHGGLRLDELALT